MAATRAKGQVRVRGTCGSGHVTEARSDPGRVTWEGVCSTEGCELPVKAKRVPRDRTPAAPPVPAPAVVDDADNPKLRKVDYAQPAPKPRGHARRAETPGHDGGDNAGAGSPAPVQTPEGGEGQRAETAAAAAVDTGDGPTRRGLRARLRPGGKDRPRSAAFKLPWED